MDDYEVEIITTKVIQAVTKNITTPASLSTSDLVMTQSSSYIAANVAADVIVPAHAGTFGSGSDVFEFVMAVVGVIFFILIVIRWCVKSRERFTGAIEGFRRPKQCETAFDQQPPQHQQHQSDELFDDTSDIRGFRRQNHRHRSDDLLDVASVSEGFERSNQQQQQQHHQHTRHQHDEMFDV